VTKPKPASPEPKGNWGKVPPSVANWEAQLAASRPRPLTPTLPLSAREGTVATLFADDHSAEQIALVLGLSTETVRAYLVRARLKYKNAARPAPDKLQLRARLVEDGYLEE
jgi:DNA-binding CsgD family transcriptional regulator